ATDPYTVDITFPEPFAPGVLLLDNLPILPRHKLEAALKAGEFASAWGLSTPVSEIAGLGPFVLSAYVPGQRVVLERNPRYFRKAADGAALPYLDRKAFADSVVLGAAVPIYGPETSANKQWYWPDLPKTPFDPGQAKQLLASAGLSDRNGDGVLEDSRNQPVHFTLLTQKARPELERGGVVMRDALKKIGIIVDLVTVDANAVIQGFLSGQYEAVYFN